MKGEGEWEGERTQRDIREGPRRTGISGFEKGRGRRME